MAKGKKHRHAGVTRPSEQAQPAAPAPERDREPPSEGAPVGRGMLLVVAALVAVSAVVAAVALGGGSGDQEEEAAPSTELAVPWIDPDGPSPLVGAVDVNPADRSVWMSTNTGLFRIPEGAEEPERVTGRLETDQGAGEISEELVIRFTGRDALVASGHPPEGSDLPPALGLLRSQDAGRTWTSVSELGAGDFHAIQTSGELLVAGLFGEQQINVSRDGGKTFQGRTPPDALVDLEVDPADPRRWVVTTQTGIFTSTDEGRNWRQRDPTPNVRVAWAAPNALFRIDPGGPVKRSADGGATWEDAGSTGGEPQALYAESPRRLYAALRDGTLKRSEDAGETWTDLVAPPA